MMNNPQVIVALNKISKKYDGKVILSDLDLEIYDGEFLTLLGPSGCGKTTLLRLLAGLESVDGGTIHLAGDEITHIPAEHRHINTVFQSYALFPHMTVFENVAFGLEMQKVPASEIRQRVEETLAMVQQPRLLLLDESLSALDYKLRKQMQSELKALQRRLGITFVFVTHDQEEALTMSDRILVMEGGKIIQRGTPRDIYESPANLFVARFIGEINVMDGKLISQREPGIWQAEVEGRECLLHTTLPFQPDDKVLVLLRPEDLRILDQDDDQSGALRGNIRERNYKGATLDSVIELESGKQLLISEFFDEDDPDFDYRLGQEVAIHWVDSWEVVLPYEPH